MRPEEEARREVLSAYAALTRRGRNPVTAIMSGRPRLWKHYPLADDVREPTSGASFYYHSHPPVARDHGHFHIFMPTSGQSGFAHLLALAVDAHGLPTRLIATNRWVTGETWRSATTLKRLLGRLVLAGAGPAPLVSRWLEAMIRLFRREIEILHSARDARVERACASGRAMSAVLEDRRLQILATVPIGSTLLRRKLECHVP